MALEAEQAGSVAFRYERPEALQVFLVGSFNGWNPNSHPMHRDSKGQWSCEVPLTPGVYQFHFLAQIPREETREVGGAPLLQWSCGNLDFVVVTPRGGSVELGAADATSTATEGLHQRDFLDEANMELQEELLPLTRLESALIRGFRQLPDHESRSAFLDVLQESVYS